MKITLNKAVPFVRNLATAMIIAGGLLLSGQASAVSACKGLDNTACDTKTTCSWVQGYDRKDGKKVNAFCRSKAKNAAKKTKLDK